MFLEGCGWGRSCGGGVDGGFIRRVLLVGWWVVLLRVMVGEVMEG